MNPCPTCGAKREHRSKQSHDHMFAAVQTAFDNLPEDMAGDFVSPDHLRRWALIKAGFCDQRQLVTETRLGAAQVARFIAQIDTYAVVTWNANVVTVYTAHSQSLKAMGRQKFQKSKDAVLDVLAKLIGTDVADLRNAKAA